jgi:hypothetical protein
MLLLGERLIGMDKRGGDFIYAWRLSICAMHSKSSEHSVAGAMVTAACSQLSLSHVICRICDFLRSVFLLTRYQICLLWIH